MAEINQSAPMSGGTPLELANFASMAAPSADAPCPAQTPPGKPLDFATIVSIAAFAIALVYPVYLTLMYLSHSWILEPNGRPAVTDFLCFWLAGKSALHGAAATAYNPAIHHALEAAAAGHEFTTQVPWRYSPFFFFIVSILAMMPYVPAFMVWVGGALAAFALTLWRIASSRAGLLLACATPAVFINGICGQNGPLTATLIGAALLNLEVRPVASGVFLALLTFKPQFGILFPIVLVAGGYWRVLTAAVVACVAGLLASSLIFGLDTVPAFLHFLPITSNALLVHGENGFNKLQTIYGLVRWLGLGNGAGWLAQGIAIAISAAALLWLWRRDVPFTLKAAALAAATLLATPHLYVYDFAVLMVSFAFLYRERAFDTLELIGIAVANLSIGAFLFVPTPIGLTAIVIAIAIIARRVLQASGPVEASGAAFAI